MLCHSLQNWTESYCSTKIHLYHSSESSLLGTAITQFTVWPFLWHILIMLPESLEYGVFLGFHHYTSTGQEFHFADASC